MSVRVVSQWQRERNDKTFCVLCEELEMAFYVRPRKLKTGYALILVTLIVFGSNVERRIKKQKMSGVEIDSVFEVLEDEVV